MIRLALADDHPIFRQGLISLIESLGDYEIVGEASNGEEAWELVQREQPDIMISDVSMPGFGAPELQRKVQQAGIPTKIIALTVHEEPTVARPILQSGVAGYVLKTSAFEDLAQTIQKVLHGERFISPQLASRLVYTDLQPVQLSEREEQVLKLLAAGSAYKQIARQLSISVRTVETYRTRLLEKLNLETTADLIRYAVTHTQTD